MFSGTLKQRNLHEAKSANEQQDAPSKKTCWTKTKIVSCTTIQHNAQVVFHRQLLSQPNVNVTQLFQQSPRLSKLIVFADKLDQDWELRVSV